MKNLTFALSLAVVAFLSILSTAFAQSAPPPPAVPLDGGVTFLIAAGAALGVKKLLDLKRRK